MSLLKKFKNVKLLVIFTFNCQFKEIPLYCNLDHYHTNSGVFEILSGKYPPWGGGERKSSVLSDLQYPFKKGYIINFFIKASSSESQMSLRNLFIIPIVKEQNLRTLHTK